MKAIQLIRSVAAAVLLAAIGSVSAAENDKAKDASAKSTEKAKAYSLDKCIVSDEKLGDHGSPHVFTHEGREVKLCCKGCLKDFKKDSAKYIKKIEEAEKKKK